MLLLPAAVAAAGRCALGTAWENLLASSAVETSGSRGMLAGRVGLLGCPAMSGVAARGTFKDLLLLLLLVLTGSVELPRWTGMPSCPAAPTTDSA